MSTHRDDPALLWTALELYRVPQGRDPHHLVFHSVAEAIRRHHDLQEWQFGELGHHAAGLGEAREATESELGALLERAPSEDRPRGCIAGPRGTAVAPTG